MDNAQNLRHISDHVPSLESFKDAYLTLVPNLAL